MRKRAFLETLLTMGLAHAVGNLITYKALKHPKVRNLIARKIVARDKPLNPVAAGLVQAFLGPEFYEMHLLGQERLHGEKAVKQMTSKRYILIKDLVSHLPLAGFAAGIPVLPDIVAVNNLRYHITRNASPELAQEMMLDTIKSGLEHKNPKKALIKALIFSPAMALAEEGAARYARGEEVHLVHPITGQKIKLPPKELFPPEQALRLVNQKIEQLRIARKMKKQKPIIDRAMDTLETVGKKIKKRKGTIAKLKRLFRFVSKLRR